MSRDGTARPGRQSAMDSISRSMHSLLPTIRSMPEALSSMQASLQHPALPDGIAASGIRSERESVERSMRWHSIRTHYMREESSARQVTSLQAMSLDGTEVDGIQ